MENFNKKIVLEDGEEYFGIGFGADVESICEIVFNTSMVGYQEIVSDSSYANQMVVMTYPLIGNYGITDEDYETKQPVIGGIIVRDYNDIPSNFRYTKTLSEYLEENNIPGVYGLDTRKLTRSIRDKGTRKAIITNINTTKEEALKKLKEYEKPKDTLSEVKSLNKKECNVTIVPYNTSYEKIEDLKPDGIIISNGPGNPEDAQELIETVKKLRGKYPMFGIGLGHQIISLSYGAKIDKLKFGHRGGNYPVLNLETGKIEITTQNHSYVLDETSLKKTKLEVTHKNVLDNTVEGVEYKKDKIFSTQYYPDENNYLFDKFIEMMK